MFLPAMISLSLLLLLMMILSFQYTISFVSELFLGLSFQRNGCSFQTSLGAGQYTIDYGQASPGIKLLKKDKGFLITPRKYIRNHPKAHRALVQHAQSVGFRICADGHYVEARNVFEIYFDFHYAFNVTARAYWEAFYCTVT